MYDYVIIHGSFGHQYENWFPWLFKELENRGKTVLCPQFPAGNDVQLFENWAKVMDSYRPFINENTVFIGHSLGPAFITNYLIYSGLKIRKAVYVAPFYGTINIPEFDIANKPMLQMDYKKANGLAKETICLISKTDPYVPNSMSIEFANNLGAKIIFFDNAGHFNKAAGFETFEKLLDIID